MFQHFPIQSSGLYTLRRVFLEENTKIFFGNPISLLGGVMQLRKYYGGYYKPYKNRHKNV